MLRSFLLALIASCGVVSGAAVGGLQIGPIDTVVSSVTAQTTVVSEATDTATEAAGGAGSGATDSGATDTLSGGTQALAGGASGVRPGKTFHSRFDPLPRRYELLLERLELGRSPRAARARLLALLASATPELRERVVRLIRMEIRRLERGGLTARERPAVQALRGLLRSLDRQVSGETVGAARSPGQSADTGSAGARVGGVASARAGSESHQADAARSRAGSRGEAGGGTPWGPLPSPIPPSSPLDWLLLLVLLLGGIGCLLLILSLAPQRTGPSGARGAVAVRRHELRILALTVVLAGVVGLGVVMLLA